MLLIVTKIFGLSKDRLKIKGRIVADLDHLADSIRGQCIVIYLNFLYGNSKRGNNYFEELV